MNDLILKDDFDAELKLAGDGEHGVELRAQDGETLVDLELSRTKLEILHTWLGKALYGVDRNPSEYVVPISKMGPDVPAAQPEVPILGRIELVWGR